MQYPQSRRIAIRFLGNCNDSIGRLFQLQVPQAPLNQGEFIHVCFPAKEGFLSGTGETNVPPAKAPMGLPFPKSLGDSW